jgi:hypothetical protein
VAAAIMAVPTWRAARAQEQPSLAELARQEEARKKSVKVPSKVYSDKDVKRPETEPPSPFSALPAAVPTSTEKPAAQKSEPEKDEAWWRARMEKAREEVRRNEAFAEALQSRINALTGDFANRDDPYQRGRIADDRQRALAELDRVKYDLDRAKKQVADIEEEARQANVLPGWIR